MVKRKKREGMGEVGDKEKGKRRKGWEKWVTKKKRRKINKD